MKPRTKHEKHVVELAAKLPALTPSQVSYLREKCYKHQAVKRCGKYHCLDCGAEWPASTKEAQLVDAVCGVECPECGHHLQVEVTRKRKWSVGSSFQMVTVAGDCQVLRLFEVHKFIEVGKPAYYSEMEAVQIFIKPDKPEVVLARPINMNCYNNSFAYTKEISIKQTSCRYYSYTKDIYCETGAVVYPCRKVLPILKRVPAPTCWSTSRTRCRMWRGGLSTGAIPSCGTRWWPVASTTHVWPTQHATTTLSRC